MRFYLDTEFNGFGGMLISLALVSPEGPEWYEVSRELFETVQSVVADGSQRKTLQLMDPWVRQHVVPRLDKEPMRFLLFRLSFQQFIQQFDNPEIVCYWHTDAEHFCRLLDGPQFGSSLDFACRISIIRTPPGQPVYTHNALADARALMEWNEMRLAA